MTTIGKILEKYSDAYKKAEEWHQKEEREKEILQTLKIELVHKLKGLILQ